MRHNMKHILLLHILFLPFYSFSQTEITKDTTHFQNYGKKIMVIHTNNRQYYDDSTCVWEVMYPEIFGLTNRIRETSVNIMLGQEVAFGDCNDKECDRTTMYFPQLSRYWDKVKITSIKNDLLSYCLTDGHCPIYSKLCSSKTQYRLYNLRNGSEVEIASLFKKDETTQHKLDSIILEKVDFTPEDPRTIRSERQFYFEENKLFVFYDWYTIGRAETYAFELFYKEIQDLIDPSGVLPVFFSDKILTKK